MALEMYVDSGSGSGSKMILDTEVISNCKTNIDLNMENFIKYLGESVGVLNNLMSLSTMQGRFIEGMAKCTKEIIDIRINAVESYYKISNALGQILEVSESIGTRNDAFNYGDHFGIVNASVSAQFEKAMVVKSYETGGLSVDINALNTVVSKLDIKISFMKTYYDSFSSAAESFRGSNLKSNMTVKLQNILIKYKKVLELLMLATKAVVIQVKNIVSAAMNFDGQMNQVFTGGVN